MNLINKDSTLLKRTAGRCPTCHMSAPAEVWKSNDSPSKVYITRTCPTHGPSTSLLSSDARFYWLSQGDPQNAEGGCCGGKACSADQAGAEGTLGKNAEGKKDGRFESLSTCLALIEIVDSCNLACPTCYADSPVGTGEAIKAVSVEDFKRRVQAVIDRKGIIDILQLSGGEPTIHPQFFELFEWAQQHEKIKYVLLNTNGVRLASDEDFARQLDDAYRCGKFQIYLQFDGPQEKGQLELRGADLRKMRQRALERCRELNIPITLAMTVTPQNVAHVWASIRAGLEYPNVRGISFQPMFRSGRRPCAEEGRLNTADIILAAVEQSGGTLRYEDFTPLPCGDPNCATIGYLLKLGGQVRSISDFVDFSQVQGFLRDKVRYSLEDLSACGCESEPLGDLLKKFELDESNTFRLFIKPFMDAHTWDEDRIDRCCTHVIRPDGQLDSFCRYYSGFPDAKQALP